MGLLDKTSVGVNITAPALIVPGEPFRVYIEVGPWPSVPQRASLVAVLRGTERVSFLPVAGDRYDANSSTRTVAQEVVLLAAKGLPNASQGHRCTFTIAAGAPPSFQGVNCETRYWIEVRPAGDETTPLATAELHVLPAPAAAPTGAPVQRRVAPRDAASGGPILELSLSSDVLTPGDVVAGAFALGNLATNRYSGVDLWILRQESIGAHGREHATEGHHRPRLATFNVPRDGHSVPFEVTIPRGVFPSTRSVLWRLEWFVELRATRFRDASVRVPITLLPGPIAPRAATKHVSAVPAVGTERVRALWAEAGEKSELALDEKYALRGGHAGASITVRREHRGRAGIFMVGELRYPSLHLDLVIQPEGTLAALLGRGLRAGDRAWDRRHLLRGRDGAQIEALLKGPLLEGLKALSIASMDDESARVERKGAGETAEQIGPFVRDVTTLAEGLARARLGIPPPSAMATAVPAWQKLAEALGGPLETARMAVAGRRAGMEATVETEWSREGEPLHTALRLRPAWAIPPRAVARLTGARGEVMPEGWPADAAVLREPLLEGALELDVRQDLLALMLPAPIADPAALLERLDGLAALCATLRAERGPYR